MNIYPSVFVERYINGDWDDISSFIVSDIKGELGFTYNDPSERLSNSGYIKFVVNNESGNFTPNNNFQKGTPIRLRVVSGVSKTKFLGRIDTAPIDAGAWGNQHIVVTCLDWFDFATNYPLVTPAMQTTKTIDQAATTIVDGMPIQPEGRDFSTGDEVFTTVFDDVGKNTTAYGELNKLLLSEMGYSYLKQGGATLVIENNGFRNGLRELAVYPIQDGSALLKTDGFYLRKIDGGKILLNQSSDAIFDNSQTDLQITHGKNLINQVSIRAFPKFTDTSLINLYKLNSPLKITALGSITIKSSWTNPIGGDALNATNVQTPSFNFNSKKDGSGTNLSANITLTPTVGTESGSYIVSNSGAKGWLRTFTIQGYGIYRTDPVEVLVEDTDSQDDYGVNQTRIDQKYQDQIESGINEANKILDDEKEPRNVVDKISYLVNSSQENFNSFMYLDIGDMINVKEDKPASDAYYYIQGQKFKIELGGIIMCDYVIKDTYSFKKGLSPIALRFSSETGSKNAVNFGTMPRLSNLTNKTISCWVYVLGAAPSTAPIVSKWNGEDGYAFWQNNGASRIMFVTRWTGVTAQWQVTAAALQAVINQWVHLAVTYDNSSTSNDPIIYLNGSSQSLTEVVSPSGTVEDDSLENFILGNNLYPSFELSYRLRSLIKDVRVYNRILTPTEISTIANNENDYTTVNDSSLLFQGVGVKTERLADYIDNPITPDMKLIDNIYGARGDATYDTSNPDYQLKGATPDDTSY
jgi:hypothetical protein